MIRDKYNYEKKIYNREPKKVFRFLSFLIDLSILLITYIICAFCVKATPMASFLRETYESIQIRKDNYALETKYGFKVYEFDENTQYVIHEEDGEKFVVYTYDSTDKTVIEYIAKQLDGSEVDNGYEYYKNNFEIINKNFSDKINADASLLKDTAKYLGLTYLSLLITFIPGEIIIFLVVPLTNKDRATIGGLIFKFKVTSFKNDEEAKWWQIFIKFLYILIVETAIPLLLINAVITCIFVLILDMAMILITQNDRTIRDFVSGTKHIEKDTYQPTVPIEDLPK